MSRNEVLDFFVRSPEFNDFMNELFGISSCIDNSDCNENDYCFFENCYIGPGTCEVRPEYCPDNYDPVCGCNFITYSNTCEAAANGVSVAYMGECF